MDGHMTVDSSVTVVHRTIKDVTFTLPDGLNALLPLGLISSSGSWSVHIR